jgi:hypothetical protein
MLVEADPDVGGIFPLLVAVAVSAVGGGAGATEFLDRKANHKPMAMAMAASGTQTLFMT